MHFEHALVTGGSRGIGRSIVLALSASGTRVTLVARDAQALERVAEEIRERGGRCEVVVADVSDADAWADRMRRVFAHDPFDLVVANAGVGLPSPGASPYAWESLRDPMQTNVVGATATLTAALPQMIARGRGHLVSIGSLASYGPIPASSAYCAPKAAIDMLMECLRFDLQGTGVSVTNVRLGFVRTPSTGMRGHPMPGLLDPDDVARHILDRLPGAPREIVYPKGLAAAARIAGALPPRVRDSLWSLVRSRVNLR